MNSPEKTINILKILSRPPYEYGVTELGEEIGCGKSGTFKLLSLLVQNNMVTQNSNHKYTLGLASYLIGKAYEEHVGIAHFAKPYMEKLRDRIDENVNLGMILEGKAMIVARAESNQLVRITGKIGATRPFYASAIGKTLAAFEGEETIRDRLSNEKIQAHTEKTLTSLKSILADFAKIRERGYAVSDGEYAREAFGIGAPIRDSDGKVWAAISIGAPKNRMTPEKVAEYVPLLLETAGRISQAFCG